MRAWGLYSTRVDYGCSHELVELFADEAIAEMVKAHLFGKLRYPGMSWLTWADDEDFPDLYVRPLEIR